MGGEVNNHWPINFTLIYNRERYETNHCENIASYYYIAFDLDSKADMGAIFKLAGMMEE